MADEFSGRTAELRQKAGWYRDRADETRAIADQCHGASAHAVLEGVAITYERMAQDCDRRAISSEFTG